MSPSDVPDDMPHTKSRPPNDRSAMARCLVAVESAVLSTLNDCGDRIGDAALAERVRERLYAVTPEIRGAAIWNAIPQLVADVRQRARLQATEAAASPSPRLACGAARFRSQEDKARAGQIPCFNAAVRARAKRLTAKGDAAD